MQPSLSRFYQFWISFHSCVYSQSLLKDLILLWYHVKFRMNSGKFGKTRTVAICTDRIELRTKNKYCSDRNLGKWIFPEFEPKISRNKELFVLCNLNQKNVNMGRIFRCGYCHPIEFYLYRNQEITMAIKFKIRLQFPI